MAEEGGDDDAEARAAKLAAKLAPMTPGERARFLAKRDKQARKRAAKRARLAASAAAAGEGEGGEAEEEEEAQE